MQEKICKEYSLKFDATNKVWEIRTETSENLGIRDNLITKRAYKEKN